MRIDIQEGNIIYTSKSLGIVLLACEQPGGSQLTDYLIIILSKVHPIGLKLHWYRSVLLLPSFFTQFCYCLFVARFFNFPKHSRYCHVENWLKFGYFALMAIVLTTQIQQPCLHNYTTQNSGNFKFQVG